MDKRPVEDQLVIAGQDEVSRLTEVQLSGWNIVSITDREAERVLRFPTARRVCRLSFDDVEQDDARDGFCPATIEDVRTALAFAREVASEPLLVHCFAGISRSTAIAWLIVYEKLIARPQGVREAFEIVQALRPILVPNRHVLRLGIETLVPKAQRLKVLREFHECLADLTGRGSGW